MGTEQNQTIHRMDDVLASQVAAGEVVERPASVIKELVENSIDAGAHAIRVEIARGGIASIKVTDDGAGMSREDLAMCLQRHATSKLTSLEDLYDIRQLGFRGEALPSIASVAHMKLTTRRKEDVEGSQLACHGGEEEEIRSAGCPPGTCIEVRELFYNTPVRRKFLKSIETEGGHAEEQVRLHALAFPDIRFTLVRDGETVFDVAATDDMRQRIAELGSLSAAGELLRIRPATGLGVHVEGFLTPLTAARRNRKEQYVFLNGRAIEDKLVSRAVRDGYGGFPTGVHPGYYLYLEIEPALVDVNVHPAKREVRFRRPAELTATLIDAVASTLAEHARGRLTDEKAAQPAAEPDAPLPPPTEQSATTPLPKPKPIATAGVGPTSARGASPELHVPAQPETPVHKLRLITEPVQGEIPLPAETPDGGEKTGDEASSGFRFLGILRKQYALFENADGLVLLSIRAARERILFERLADADRRGIPSQQLLAPALIEIDARDIGLALELQPLFHQAGFRVSLFGKKTLRVEAIPIFLSLHEIEDFISELISSFSAGETRAKRNRDPYELFAIRLAHQYVRKEDMSGWLSEPMPLLRDLLHCEIPYCTPRGKPTMIPLAYSEIQRRFQAQ